MFWKGTYDIEHCKCLRAMQADFVRLDQDILTPLAGKKKLYTFETNDFWEQIKTPG
jgi:mannose-1-phosphate guanylyltransferase